MKKGLKKTLNVQRGVLSQKVISAINKTLSIRMFGTEHECGSQATQHIRPFTVFRSKLNRKGHSTMAATRRSSFTLKNLVYRRFEIHRPAASP